MKKYKKLGLLLLIIIIPCMFLLTGCGLFAQKVYVTNIVKTETIGTTDTYTIYYSNGTTTVLNIENGKDGKDGENLTLDSIKEYCDANNIDFETYLKSYLTIEYNPNIIKTATNKAIDSTVNIYTEFRKATRYGTTTYYDSFLSAGAGVIYKMDMLNNQINPNGYSYIITNFHVIYDKDSTNKYADVIRLYQHTKIASVGISESTDSNGYPIVQCSEGVVLGTYIGGAMNYDIAVIQVKTSDLLLNNPNAKPVKIASSYEPADMAIAIGNPEGEGTSVTSGIISVKSEYLTMSAVDGISEIDLRVMRIDTAVNGGNSGGGLFNENGELIGIVNAKVIDNEIDNISYALPYDNVTKVADNIIYYYKQQTINPQPVKVKKLHLGINYSTIINEHLLISSVDANSFAYDIGLKSNDIITKMKINNTVYNIDYHYQLGDALLNIRKGDKVLFTITRIINNVETELTLGITTSTGVESSYIETIQ